MSKRIKKKLQWYPLDNAAKIYPPTASSTRAHVFSFSAVLTEEIDGEMLKESVNNLLKIYPTFKTRLMRGYFWYYLEENEKPFKVFEEKPYYLKSIDYRENNGYLFQVLYIRDKITIKFFHALTDGTGGFKFFTALLCEYLKVAGKNVDTEGVIKPLDAPATEMESDDSFLTYEKKNISGKTEKIRKPYHIGGTPFSYDGCGMITAKISLPEVKDCAKKFGVTVTAFLSAVYMQSIYEAFLKNKPVANKFLTVLVPCNLRKRYGGETLRNFTMFARFSHDYNVSEPSFDDLVLSAQEQITKGIDKEALDDIIHENVKTERNFFIKMTPLPLKNLVMRAAYSKVGEVLQTVDFSNLGQVVFPESVAAYIKHVIFAIAPTFSCGHQTGVVGFKDNLYITFSRNFTETDIERVFVRKIPALGATVTLFSNYWESSL